MTRATTGLAGSATAGEAASAGVFVVGANECIGNQLDGLFDSSDHGEDDDGGVAFRFLSRIRGNVWLLLPRSGISASHRVLSRQKDQTFAVIS